MTIKETLAEIKRIVDASKTYPTDDLDIQAMLTNRLTSLISLLNVLNNFPGK